MKDPVVKPPVRPVWAQSALTTDIVDPGDQFVATGFPRSAVPPVRQVLNWVLNYCSNAVRYLCRSGIAEYDPAETYALHDVVRGDDSCLYQSLAGDNFGNVPSKSLVHWGPVKFYCRTAEEVVAGVSPINLHYPELNVLRYGADNTGRSACDKAIADAVSVACPRAGSAAGARRVYFPAGQYLVTLPIDLSNSRANGTLIKDGLVIQGESVGATRIIGRTGAGRPVIETTGSQWLTIEDLTVTFAATDYSTVGIFQGLGKALGESQNQKFSRLVISMCDDPTANGGAGTVGIWNFGAEENTYDTLWVVANLPLMFTAHNPSPNTGFTTPVSYQSLAKSHSLGMCTFSGECFFVALNGHQPSIITEDANSIKFVNSYLSNIGGAGTNDSAWKIYGSLDGLDYNGLVESHGRFLEIFGIVAGARVRVTFGGVERPSTERILLQRGAQGQLLNSDFNFVDSVARERQLVSAFPLMPAERISCFIQNCTFRVDCDQQFTTIQENVLANPSTGNITIESVRSSGSPYRYSIDSNRTQEVAIPDTKCRVTGISSSELFRLVLPTVYGNRNQLSASISVEGMAYVANSAAGNMSCKFVRAQITVVVDNLGQVAVAADTHFSGTTASTSAERNDVVELTIGALAGDGGQFVRVMALPVLSGSENAAVNFAGTARLQWHGNDSRAPRLQIPL